MHGLLEWALPIPRKIRSMRLTDALKGPEKALFKELNTPFLIQQFLDSIKYNTTERTLSPLFVLREQMAHCMDGGLFAAASLRCLGYRPLIIDLAADNDDDHIIAVFRQGNCWGAVAKSNTTVLRFREPVYRSLRELAMSYFDFYYNLNSQKTLRSYSRPIDLSRFDKKCWETTSEDLGFIGDYTYTVTHIPLISDNQLLNLNDVPKYLFEAGFMGADIDGLFKPH
jgi:hypothetical protein